MKKCRVCKSEFKPFNSLAVACSPKCALAIVEQKKAKKHKKELYQYRQDNKTLGQLTQECQKVFNLYIRTRDAGKPCVCCDRVYADDSGQWDAGHYRTVGASPQHRFNTMNCFRQSKYCNKELGGNYVAYRKKLTERFGDDKILALEYDNAVKPMNKLYVKRLKKIFAKRTRHLKKIRESVNNC